MFAVIGLGSLGNYVARALFAEGQHVLGIDSDAELVRRANPFCSELVVADATDKEALRAAGVHKASAVFVSLGENLAPAVLVTLHLRDLGVGRIIVKVLNEDQEKILLRAGASKTVVPKRDIAKKLAQSLVSPNVIDVIPLGEGHSLLETAAPRGLIGKSLVQSKLRSKYGVEVVLIKDALTSKTEIPPNAERVLKDSDYLLMLGRDEDLKRVQKL